MQLYYTTTTGYNAVQSNPDRSLGGYKSGTPVMNADFSNLFDSISLMTIRNGRDEYRALILRNEFNHPIKNLMVTVQYPEDFVALYSLAFGVLGDPDKYGNCMMESVNSPFAKPFRAKFFPMGIGWAEIESSFVVGALLVTPELNPGQEVGLWISRHIDKARAKEQYENICTPDPADPTGRRYMATDRPQEEAVNIVFTWDD